MDFANNDQNIGVSDFDVEDQTLKSHQEMKDVSELQSSDANIHHTAEITEHKKDDASGQMSQHFFEGTMNEDASDKVQHNTNQSVPDPVTFDTSDSTTSGTISSETREAMDTLIVDLGRLSIPANQLVRQLPIDIPITEIVVRSDTNTPLARNMMPSKIYKSPYLTSFGSSEKVKEVMEDVIRSYFPFEGCEITNQAPSYLIDEYIQWVTRGFLKTHANKKPSEDMYRARASSLGFEMMDYVVAFLIDKKWFHAMSQPKKCWTDQPELDAYKNKQTGTLLEPHHPFNVEYAQGIMQQECDSLDCGLYVATFAEFLSDQLVIPSDTDGYLSSYLRNRYAALLWRYDSDKVKGGYISENDDPPKPKGQFTTPTEEDFVNID
ncbi:hypothetical protein KY284_020641 [Solanum tuberosum]|nr:hypothetical protein KY284_020641 [Solanum tuberosum]